MMFVNALGHLAMHHGMTEVAKITVLNRESLYMAFNGKAQPKWDTIHRLIKAFNIGMAVAA